MSFKKFSILCALAIGLTVSVQASSSRANEGYSVIVAPNNIIIMNIAFDLFDQKPSVLISYEPDGNAADPFLHVWNKTQWVPLSFENYQNGSFIKRRPNQVVVLGNEDALTEALLNGSASWGPQSFVVPVDNARTIINGLGQRYNFTMYEWRWFADRYDLDLVEVNAQERNEVWYDRPNYFKDGEGKLIPPRKPEVFKAPRKASPPPPNSALPPPASSGAVRQLDANPAVTRTTPAVTTVSESAVTVAPAGRIQTLESIEKVSPPVIEETVISSGTISAQPPLNAKQSDFQGWNDPDALRTETPGK